MMLIGVRSGQRTTSAGRSRYRQGREQGAIIILFPAILVLILALMGLAIDASRLYNRRVELQAVADFAAISAAGKLAGTEAGIDAAISAAATATAMQKFEYSKSTISWSDSAIEFSASPDSGWISAGAARAAPNQMRYVKIDTRDLASDPGQLDLILIKVIAPAMTTASTSATAVAGRSTLNLTPLAVCAMSDSAAASRPPSGELVEYGFRRGVAYDLMQLNPNGTSPVSFAVNPIDLASGVGGAGNTAPSILGPFVCTGTMPAVASVGGQVLVSSPFPLASLYDNLNSRFGDYTAGVCDYHAAPPDTNIKSFLYSAGSSWMKVAPSGQSAQSLTSAGRLHTVADPDPHPASNTAGHYGQLWSYAKPVPFSAYTPGVAEPAAGYAPFDKSAWPGLYSPGLPEPKNSYPLDTPYMTGGAQHLSPSSTYGRPLRQRRVLHLPLVECPVAGSSATVLAIGRFFMTVPATASSLKAEFAGIASETALRGPVELYQ